MSFLDSLPSRGVDEPPYDIVKIPLTPIQREKLGREAPEDFYCRTWTGDRGQIWRDFVTYVDGEPSRFDPKQKLIPFSDEMMIALSLSDKDGNFLIENPVLEYKKLAELNSIIGNRKMVELFNASARLNGFGSEDTASPGESQDTSNTEQENGSGST